MTKNELISIAEETVSISKNRKYNVNGKEIPINKNFSTKLYDTIPECLKELNKEGTVSFIRNSVISTVEMFSNTNNITVLNFASAKNPGGGFLNGSRAQEESIARTSNMYLSLKKYQKEFYDENKKENNPLYNDKMIFSRNISVFRKDNGQFLQKPILTNIITSPAVNANVAKKRNISEKDIDITMENRIRKIIHLAALENTDVLILGAFGTGVFGNDDVKVAKMFKKVLEEELKKYWFKMVVFSIYDTQEKFERFQDAYNN